MCWNKFIFFVALSNPPTPTNIEELRVSTVRAKWKSSVVLNVRNPKTK